MFDLAWKNIQRRRVQSLVTVAITLVTVMVFVMVLGVLQVMNNGLELSKQRLGADAVLIPKYAPTQSEELLFTASPENIYMSEDVLKEAMALEGVSALTPQFYAQTLALGCCEPGEEARIIGFDTETDFILAPFLGEETIKAMGPEDIILGSSMDSDIVGYKYMILGEQLFAAHQMEPTGTGMDSTIFMDIDTCRALCLSSDVLREDWQKKDPYEQISVIMVRFEEGVDPEAFVKQVEDSGMDARCVLTSETITSLQTQLETMMKVIFALWAASMVIAVMALFGRFNSLAKERKKEIGLLRALGLKKGQVFTLVLAECGIMAVAGGVIGSVIAVLSMGYVIDMLKDAFMLSPSVWNASLALICGGSGVLLAVAIGFVSAVGPALRSAALDPQVAITQGEV
ncbi:MAG: FtsX-like permease family protein [Lachnospiraceae bacterium]|nr:FtsX-like permease family protein [Lachnospiraceae bacterium]